MSSVSDLCVGASESGLNLKAKFQQLESSLARVLRARNDQNRVDSTDKHSVRANLESTAWESLSAEDPKLLLDQCEAYKVQLETFEASVQTFVEKQQLEREFSEKERNVLLEKIKVLETKAEIHSKENSSAIVQNKVSTAIERNEFDAVVKEKKELEAQVEEIQGQLKEQHEELTLLQKEHHNLKQENSTLVQQNAKSNEELESMKQQFGMLHDKLREAEEKASALHDSEAIMQRRLGEYKSKTASLESVNTTLQKYNEEFKQRLLEAETSENSKNEELKRLHEVIATLRNDVRHLQLDSDNSLQERDALQHELFEIRSERDELFAQNNRLQTVLNAEFNKDRETPESPMQERLILQRRYILSKLMS